MAKKLYEENSIQDIANAIRSQNGTHDAYTVAQMGNAVRAIHTQPDLETLNATENGNYVPSIGKDGFSSVNVNVSGDEAVVQPLSVNENGTYNPPIGVDGYAPVTVNVEDGGSSESNMLADWDFTKSLTDSINEFTVTLKNGATQDSNGVNLNASSHSIIIPTNLKALARTYELDIGAMSIVGSDHHRFFMWSSEDGLIYRSNGKWSFYSHNSWATDSNISDYDYFANSTIKILVDVNGYIHIYKNNVLVYEPDNNFVNQSGNVYIGSNACSANSVVIKALRVIDSSKSVAVQPLSVTQNGTYTPPSGVDGYAPVTVNVSGSGTPILQEKTATENGIVLPDSGYDGLSKVTVNVEGGSAVVQPLSVTRNGTYSPPSGVDGYAPVTVNVSGGGKINEMITEIARNTFIAFSQKSNSDLDTYIAGFDAYTFEYHSTISGRQYCPAVIQDLTLSDILGLLHSENNIILEYYTNIGNDSYARSMFENLKQNLQAVNLGRISGNGVLTDSINNYSYIMISSCYTSNGYCAYDVSMIYKPCELDTWYATGMKDRNSAYRSYVKFGENNSVVVKNTKNDSGSNGSAVIYGIP